MRPWGKVLLRAFFILACILFISLPHAALAEGFITPYEIDPATFDADEFISSLQGKRHINAEISQVVLHWGEFDEETRGKLSQFVVLEPISAVDAQLKNEAIALEAAAQSTSSVYKENSSIEVSNANYVATKNFRILWGDSPIATGSIAFSAGYWTDSDGDNLPKYIEFLIGTDPYVYTTQDDIYNATGALEIAWSRFIEDNGFPLPPGTDTNLFDVYISDTGVVADGSTKSLPSSVYGLVTDYSTGIPYMMLNSRFTKSTIAATAVHEFTHAAQRAYAPMSSLTGTHIWLAESSATWTEELLYPAVNDYVQYIDQWTTFPYGSLFGHPYSGVLLMLHTTQNYTPNGTDPVQTIKTIFQGFNSTASSIEAMDNFFANQTAIATVHSLDEAFVAFAPTCLDFEKYYADGASFAPLVKTSAVTTTIGDDASVVSMVEYKAPQNYGLSYWGVTAQAGSGLDDPQIANRLAFTVTPEISANLSAAALLSTSIGKARSSIQSSNTTSDFMFTKTDGNLFNSADVLLVALPPEGTSPTATTKYNYSAQLSADLKSHVGVGWNQLAMTAGGESVFLDAGDETTSIWKFDAQNQNWDVYLPGQSLADNQDYATEKGYGLFSQASIGDGVWVDSTATRSVDSIIDTSNATISLQQGWNMVGMNRVAYFNATTLLQNDWFTAAWMYSNTSSTWSVQMDNSTDVDLTSFMEAKGFELLEYVPYGQGFWIQSTSPAQITFD